MEVMSCYRAHHPKLAVSSGELIATVWRGVVICIGAILKGWPPKNTFISCFFESQCMNRQL